MIIMAACKSDDTRRIGRNRQSLEGELLLRHRSLSRTYTSSSIPEATTIGPKDLSRFRMANRPSDGRTEFYATKPVNWVSISQPLCRNGLLKGRLDALKKDIHPWIMIYQYFVGNPVVSRPTSSSHYSDFVPAVAAPQPSSPSHFYLRPTSVLSVRRPPPALSTDSGPSASAAVQPGRP